MKGSAQTLAQIGKLFFRFYSIGSKIIRIEQKII